MIIKARLKETSAVYDVPLSKKVYVYGETEKDPNVMVELCIEGNHDLKKLVDQLLAILNER